MRKFTIVTMQLLCVWIFVPVIQLSDPLPKSNETLVIPLMKEKKPPKHLRKKRDISELPLKSVDNDFFYGWVKCGTPGQPLRCIFDTGSPDLWVMSDELCKEDSRICDESCGHYTYDNTKSRTYYDLNQRWSIKYQDNSEFHGYWCRDSVEIGGLRIDKMVFAEATYGRQDDPCNKYDCIFGMAYSETYKETCAFRNMMRQHLVTYPIFSFYLNRNCDDSVLVLGGSDRRYYRGDLVFTEVVYPDSWTIEFTSVRIGDREVMGRCEALVDSGTSLILCPPDFMDAFYEQVGDPDELDCPDMDDLPVITFCINDMECHFSPKDYMLQEEENADYKAECMCGLDSSDQDQFILGNVFMHNYYTVFNMAKGLVGVAKSRSCDN